VRGRRRRASRTTISASGSGGHGAAGLARPLLFTFGEPLGSRSAQGTQGLGRGGEGCAHGRVTRDARRPGERVLDDVGHLLDAALHVACALHHVPQGRGLLRLGARARRHRAAVVLGLVAKPAALDVLPRVVAAESGPLHDPALHAVADA
jgi:hypothetical protein